ncbi:TetR/AcrR family transcriptional regulator [Streptacidiphilus cavernicola]|uniref:TetR/AcrR family transcriptional regulator n=1 Tax=Streptacidiphilus cavernicola TaxID=3342716 RepID=A0ABV6VQ67_9ACTN
MSAQQVNWTARRHAVADDAGPVGRRELRKRATRELLIDTATRMSMERGFDEVRVVEIARACGVATATVYNYFPSKESLIFDIPDPLLDRLRAALVNPASSAVEGMLVILDGVLDDLVVWLTDQGNEAQAAQTALRFEAMARDTPTLQAHYLRLLSRVTDTAREALAARTGKPTHDPELRIAAAALAGLWPVQADASCRHLEHTTSPKDLRAAIAADVRRAAHVLEHGLAASI